MVSKEPVYIAGAHEHPTREAPDKSVPQLHAEVAKGAVEDAGIEKDDIDGYLGCSISDSHTTDRAPHVMVDYLGLDISYGDSSDFDGAAPIAQIGHAASAIRDGKCDVALITFAARPRTAGDDEPYWHVGDDHPPFMQQNFWYIYAPVTLNDYALAARRHMHEHGTTREQLAEVRVATSHHAQYNEHALYPEGEPVSVEDVVDSKTIADPLGLLDCCVVSDGGGALVVVSEDVKEDIDRECVEVLGHGEAVGDQESGYSDITTTAAKDSGAQAFDEADLSPDDVDYAGLYDSFTITVVETLEDLGFCEKGEGGEFVEGGTLQAPDGDLPLNTDGGGLSNNHPGRGGMFKVLETVRQLRGEAHPEVQVDADVGIANAMGGTPGQFHGCSTVLLGGEGR
jgi:acetyl-CoA C-acetyltransferase